MRGSLEATRRGPTPMAMDVARKEEREAHLRWRGGHMEEEGGRDGESPSLVLDN